MFRPPLIIAVGLFALGAFPVEARAAAPKIARIVVTPSGATLHPSETVTFSAQALDSAGNPIPGVPFTFKSSKKTVLSVTGSVGTALKNGYSVVTVKGKNKSVKVVVAVVGTPAGGGAYTAAGLTSVNHVLADDDFVYWTEYSPQETKIRKTPKSGGPIFDLASEPARDRRGLGVAYAQLQQIGDRLYWTRETIGFFSHWSIRSVPKAGGAVTEVLKQDVSITPLLAHRWGVSGRFVIVALDKPEELGLPENTIIGAYDTVAATWSALVTGGFQPNKTLFLAATDTAVFLRAVSDAGDTSILRTAPDGAANSFTTIFSRAGGDQDLDEVADTDGVNVYYWSRVTNDPHRLFAIPVGGGPPVEVISGTFGHGLTTDGANLFFAKEGTIVMRVPVTGGTPAQVQTGVYFTSTNGRLAQDSAALYLAKQEANLTFAIVRVPK